MEYKNIEHKNDCVTKDKKFVQPDRLPKEDLSKQMLEKSWQTNSKKFPTPSSTDKPDCDDVEKHA